jgi:hypothetical protein
MADRLTGKPIHLDISDLHEKYYHRNKFILGSGSGKSFFTNHMVRQYYEQGRMCCWWIQVIRIKVV